MPDLKTEFLFVETCVGYNWLTKQSPVMMLVTSFFNAVLDFELLGWHSFRTSRLLDWDYLHNPLKFFVPVIINKTDWSDRARELLSIK